MTSATRSLDLQLLADFSAEIAPLLEEGLEIVAFDVDLDGSPVLTLESGASAAREVSSDEDYEKSRAEAPHRIVVLRQRGDSRQRWDVTSDLHFDFAQPLSDDRLLLVTARARRSDEAGGESNARVYSADGALLHEWRFGDGISEVQLGGEGRIWVGYFDEGIYGGWGEGKNREPLGATGLVAFDERSGERVYTYAVDPELAGVIDDCYALNATPAETWAYYSSGFFLVRLAVEGVKNAWEAPAVGSHAFAVAGELVLLAGSSEDPLSARLYRVDPGARQPVELGSVRLRWPDDVAVERLKARGPYVLARCGGAVFRADLRKLAV